MASRFLRIGREKWAWGFALVVLVVCCGCGKQEKPASEEKPSATTRLSEPMQPELAIHWIGKARFMQDTNAAYQAEIWNMPESKALESQTLDKSARALSKALSGGDTNAFASMIRPLLDDVVQSEIYFELRGASNHPSEIALAVRLLTNRVPIWQTNLSLLIPTATNGYRMESQMVGDWMVWGVSTGSNSFLGDFLHRFGGTELTPGTNWIEIKADLAYLFRSNSWMPADKLPYLNLTATGDGKNVRTRGEMAFTQPIPMALEAWDIPTNWIHDPLVSFTAVRGIKSWVELLKSWQTLNAGAAPNQGTFWAMDGLPARTYFVANWPDSSNRFYSVTEKIKEAVNRSIATQLWGSVNRLEGTNGITQTGPPFFRPILRREDEMVIGGFSDLAEEGRPLPPELLPQFISQTNLFLYDWELTGSRAFGGFHLSQMIRSTFGKVRVSPDSAGARWLQNLAPKLANSVTVAKVTADRRGISFMRTSSVGFTGIELNAIIDWAESPVFPEGTHTFSTLGGEASHRPAAPLPLPSSPAPSR